MTEIVGFKLVGARYMSNGAQVEGWIEIKLSDGSSRYYSERKSLKAAVAELADAGVGVDAVDEWVKTGNGTRFTLS